MEMSTVDSTNLSAVGYDINQALLRIEFHNGSVYEYYDVPQNVFEELMAAESKGSYAAVNIYKNYNQQRIG
ncbi:MAG: KTSC domain-containing protein [Bacteroidetes bacterium]|nr:KTSC domain-containing protein [Bacteroidota bacterium]